jgi:hypothetical protein
METSKFYNSETYQMEKSQVVILELWQQSWRSLPLCRRRNYDWLSVPESFIKPQFESTTVPSVTKHQKITV